MPYSMVGTPALGYDLARLPHGTQVATVVRTALRCTPRHLELLASRHPGRRTGAAGRAFTPESMAQALPAAADAVGHALEGRPEAGAETLRRLESAVLGSPSALDRYLRDDVLAWSTADGTDGRSLVVASCAADVLVDAATSAYAEGLEPRVRRRMATPMLGSGVPLVDAEVPTGHAAVDHVLSVVSGLDGPGRGAWRAAVDAARPGTASWAPAMHQCTWALHLTERLRLAADVQMAAVMAFRAGGFTARDASYGVWNALSGVVAASLVSDLVSDDDHDTLMGVWRRVYG
jgi:hypothetical protein